MFRGIKNVLIILVLPLLIGCVNTSKDTSSNSSQEVKKDNEKTEIISEQDLSKYFSGYNGCFLLFDQKKGEYIIFNKAKSEKQISPCSTFKIVNSLIGLETNVLEDENTTFNWDGTKYPIEDWNKDQSLSNAVANSVVWYFQIVASKVGEERIKDYINKIGYGNEDISGGITKFWLQSSLKISPREQVDMLKNMYNYKLPFLKRNVDIVKKVLKISEKDGIILSGKTGSGTIENKGVNGWFTGYVERDDNVFFFATNIEAEDKANGVIAKEITMQILKDKKIYL